MSSDSKYGAIAHYKKRFGSSFSGLVDELAAVLASFSLDVVGVCASYLVSGCATPGVEPVVLKIIRGRFVWCCYSIACAPNGQMFVGDDRSLTIYSADGEFVSRAETEQLQGTISGLCFDNGSNELYVCNRTASIVVCDANGKFLRSFMGDIPTLPRKFKRPWSVAADGNGRIFITEGNNAIHVYSREGKRMYTIDRGEPEPENLHAGCIAINKETNEMFVTDSGRCFVQVFDLKQQQRSHVLRRFGERCKNKPIVEGNLECPVPIALDHNGNVLVGDSSSKIRVFRPDGSFLMSFGQLGQSAHLDPIHTGVWFDRPRSICVCDDGRILVGDFNLRVQVLAFPA